MKKHISILLFFVFCSVAGIGQGYWEEIPTPFEGAPTEIIETNDNVLLARFLNYNVYFSEDFGESWQKLFEVGDLGLEEITHVSINKTGNVFVSGRKTNLQRFQYYSDDKGQTWIEFTNARGWSIVQDSEGTLFSIERTGSLLYPIYSVLRSNDFGFTWDTCFQEQLTGIENWNDGVQLDFLDRLFVKSEFNLNISTDGGNTWQSKSTGQNNFYFMSKENTIFEWHLLSYGKISRYSNGNTEFIDFQSMTLELKPLNFRGFYHVGDTLICYASDYLFKSNDDGVTWTVSVPNSKHALYFPKATPLSNGEYLVGGVNYLLKSSVFDANWKIANQGIANYSNVMNFKFLGDTAYLAETVYGLYSMKPDSLNWNLISETQHFYGVSGVVSSHFAISKNGKVATWLPNGILLSEDIEMTNTELIYPDDSLNRSFRGVGFGVNDSTIFVSTKNGVSRSNDNGKTWQLVTDSLFVGKIELTDSVLIGSLSFFGSNGHPTSRLFRSFDNGENWESANAISANFSIGLDKKIYIPASNKIFVSGDYGDNWSEINVNGFCNSVSATEQGYIFTGQTNDNLASYSNGEFWQVIPEYPNIYGKTPNKRLFTVTPDNYLIGTAVSSPNYYRIFKSKSKITEGAYINGKVEKDSDLNCLTYDPEVGLRDWIVKIDGQNTWYTNTDTIGRYSVFADTGNYIVSTQPQISNIFWEICMDSQQVNLSSSYDTSYIDFSIIPLTDCPYIGVDLAVPYYERCFESNIYVSYCNYGTQATDSAYVDIQFESNITVIDTSISFDSLGNNIYRVFIGHLGITECGQFHLSIIPDCDSTYLGETACVSVHAYPDSICVPIPNWSGAEITATAHCEGDTVVHFDITNNAPAATQLLDYIIVEDDVVLFQGQDSYGPNETKTKSVPMPDGHFLRLESDQEPNHPFSNQIAAWVEGCGGLGSLGFINQYFIDNGIVSEDVECVEVVGSFDPNDKQGFPLGYGQDRLIKANQDIEYLIRFQNTGTAPAHFVVIKDTLSARLDPATLRMGASSHPYTWQLSGQGILTVRFDDINLPDSTSNEPESHGFISFRIEQQPDLSDGVVIRNTASIYFDFNQAVVTNTTRHRIGSHFLTVSLADDFQQVKIQVGMLPNPVAERALLRFSDSNNRYFSEGEKLQFSLLDISGKTLQHTHFQGDTYLFERKNLASGLYFFQIKNEIGVLIASGKVVLR